MPGLIGASIFSPLPARGYRFHSLHFEIILIPWAALQHCNKFQQTSPAAFAPQFERLTATIVPEPPAEVIRICGLTAADARASAAKQAFHAKPVTRIHQAPLPPLLLAGNRDRGDDQPAKTGTGGRHAEQSSDRSGVASESRRKRNSRCG